MEVKKRGRGGLKKKERRLKKKGLGVKKIGVGLKKKVWGLKKGLPKENAHVFNYYSEQQQQQG